MIINVGWALPMVLAEALLTPTEITVLWGLHHPYWLIAIAIAVIIFLQLAISIAGQLLRYLLKGVSRSPLFLGRWLLTKTTVREPSQEQQIATILQRLDRLQEEQTRLLADLKGQLPNKE